MPREGNGAAVALLERFGRGEAPRARAPSPAVERQAVPLDRDVLTERIGRLSKTQLELVSGLDLVMGPPPRTGRRSD